MSNLPTVDIKEQEPGLQKGAVNSSSIEVYMDTGATAWGKPPHSQPVGGSSWIHLNGNLGHNDFLGIGALHIDHDPQLLDYVSNISFDQVNVPYTSAFRLQQCHPGDIGHEAHSIFPLSYFDPVAMDLTHMTMGDDTGPLWPTAFPPMQSNAPSLDYVQYQAESTPLPLGFPAPQPGPSTQALFPPPRQAEASLTDHENAGLRCPKGCDTTFRRPGDFRRHMKKHAPSEFKCIVKGCKREFYRLDKLRSHVKVHGHNL